MRPSATFKEEGIVKSEIKSLITAIAHLESRATAARLAGDESLADGTLREALRLASEEADRTVATKQDEGFLGLLQTMARLALRCGEVTEAKRALQSALAANPAVAKSEEWSHVFDIASWTDEWLVAAVRRDPPDVPALDVLADRYWEEVFGRCYLLTLNHDKASDLAQQAWVRVLRTRERLLPAGNFPAYVWTIATNLWRDAQRWSRRAGPMAERNLVSLNQPSRAEDDDSVLLADALPDSKSPDDQARALLKLDIDQALANLPPKLRDVLIARFMTGESSAEIAKRYGRTEQTISGWIREAIQQMKGSLEDPLPEASLVEESLF
jgi:RNA polymerase sigma-70 factor (ECF subfamily)